MSSARGFAVLLLVVGLLSTTSFAGGDLGGVPAKIQLTPVASAGNRKIKVELLDPANKPARATKDLKVEVQTKSETGAVEKSVVEIKQGDASMIAQLPVQHTAGIVEVTASHAELAEGGTVVNLPPSAADNGVSPTPAPTAMATAALITTIAPSATPATTAPPHINLPSGAAPSEGVGTMGDNTESRPIGAARDVDIHRAGARAAHDVAATAERARRDLRRGTRPGLSGSGEAVAGSRGPASVEESERPLATAAAPAPGDAASSSSGAATTRMSSAPAPHTSNPVLSWRFIRNESCALTRPMQPQCGRHCPAITRRLAIFPYFS